MFTDVVDVASDNIGYAIYQEKLNGNLIENGHVSMNYLRGLLPGTAIPVLGMARSLYLNPCDFWLWDYLKSKVFATKTNTMAELKDCIRNVVDAKPISMIRRVMANVAKILHTLPVWRPEEDI